MCLSTISNKKPKKSGYFYKVFDLDYSGGLYFPFMRLNRMKEVPVGKWIKAARLRRRADNGEAYITGFHGFLSARSARLWGSGDTVVRCKYRNAHVAGTQDELKVIVADEIFVPKRKRYATGGW